MQPKVGFVLLGVRVSTGVSVVSAVTAPSDRRRRLESLATAAEYADVCPRTIRRWIAAGLLTGYRAGPKLLRVDLNELDAMLAPIPAAG